MSTVHTQLLTDDASGLLLERSFRLRVVAGPDQGKEHMLDEGTTMVGTHADNDMVITDATVSRYHLEIRVRRDGIEVRDLDTTNGTLTCPWHGFCYDAASGECFTAPAAQLEQLPLRVDSGQLWIRVGA